MNTIELKRIYTDFSNPSWCIEPTMKPEFYTEIESKMFILPDGYRAARCNGGSMEFYNRYDNYCELYTDRKNRPIIIDGDKQIILRKVPKARG